MWLVKKLVRPIKFIRKALAYIRRQRVPVSRLAKIALLIALRPVLAVIAPWVKNFSGKCPICGSNARFEFENFWFRLLKCDSCKHVFVSNPLTQTEYNKLYSDWSYWEKDRHRQEIYEIGPGPQWQPFLRGPMSRPLRRKDGKGRSGSFRRLRRQYQK